MNLPPAEQMWDPIAYERNARFVSDLGAPALALLAPQPGERILDLGCGDGVLSAEIAAAGALVTAVDASREFVAAAAARGLDAQHMDAHELTFQSAFDAVFSNAALHWMLDPAGVAERVHRALVPGGRFVAEMGAHGNVAAIRVALDAVLARRGIDATARSPWFFPTVDEYRAVLESAGFAIEEIGTYARPTALPTGIEGWLETFAGPFLRGLEPNDGATLLGEAVALLKPVLCDRAGRWTADYVRLRFRARR